MASAAPSPGLPWPMELLLRTPPRAALYVVLACLLASLVLLIARAHYVSFSGAADTYCVGEWLINYAGGFVRRGLGGAVILWLTQTVGLRPRLAVFVVLAVCYAITFMALGVALLRSRRLMVLDLLLVVSPFGALFPLLHSVAANRKEVLLFALAALAYLTHLGALRGVARYVLWSVALAVLVAVYDGAIFFVPLFLLYLQALTAAPDALGWRIVPVALPALAVFIVGYLYSSHVDIDSICAAIARSEHGRWCVPRASAEFPFAASWLKATAVDGLRSIVRRYTLVTASETMLLGLIGLLPVALALARDSAELHRTLHSMPAPPLFLGACVIALIVLFSVASDWNRWFYILTSLLTMLHFALCRPTAAAAQRHAAS